MQSALHKVVGPPEVIPQDLTGYVAVVTGGANGIGDEISRLLAKAGAHVVMINRKEDQGHASIAEIKKQYSDAQIEWKQCDMGKLSEIRDVFSALGKSLDRLDFLVLSAGINTNFYDLDADGIDRHFGVNFLGQFYATNLLWPVLRKTSKNPNALSPRVVFEASEVHRMAPSNVHFGSLDEINDETMDPTQLYGRTKLAQILFAKYSLAGKVIKDNGDNIVANSVHPGTVNTNMQQQWKDAYPGWFGKVISWGMQAVGRDIEQGAYSALWTLVRPDEEAKSQNGWYYNDPAMPGKESKQASDPALAESLWDLSHRIVREKLGDGALVDWNVSV